MKKLLFLILVFSLCCVGIVSARPFIVCDVPDSAPDHYILVLNTGAEIETPYPLHYDLESLAPGEWVATARAVSILWGTSEPSVPLEFTKPSLIPPILQIVAE